LGEGSVPLHGKGGLFPAGEFLRESGSSSKRRNGRGFLSSDWGKKESLLALQGREVFAKGETKKALPQQENGAKSGVGNQKPERRGELSSRIKRRVEGGGLCFKKQLCVRRLRGKSRRARGKERILPTAD